MSRKIAVGGTRCLLGLGTLLLVAGVVAQPVVGAAATTAGQVGAPVLEYVSPIGDYKAYEPQAIQSWKEANDNVGRLGGWRNYSRETTQGQPAPSAPAASGGSAPHTHHHGDKK